jgi:cyclohexadienyl dehydratase
MAKPFNLTRRTIVGGGVAVVAGGALGFIAGCTERTGNSANEASATEGESSLDAVIRRRSIRAGYSGFKPYTIANPASPSQPTGFIVDALAEIVGRMDPAIGVAWTPVTFESLSADMGSGRIDVFVDAVYYTVPRAERFIFTDPIGYFGVGAAIVRSSDNRFRTVMDLDRPGVVIALAQGWTATDFAKRVFKHARLDIVPVGDDGSVPLQNVLAGRADAALQDVPTIAQFVAANAGRVKAIDLDTPPARVAAGFLLPREAVALRDFLNVSIEVLRADGTLQRLSQRWQLYNGFERREFANEPGL